MSTLLWCDLRNRYVWIALFVTVAYGAIGFIDDAMKLGVRGSKGLSERGKLVGQFGTAAIAVLALLYTPGGFDTSIYLPFVSPERLTIHLPVLVYVPFAMFVIAGASNAVNFTDGLDGLAIGPVILSASTLGLLAYASATVLAMAVSVNGVDTIAEFDLARYLRIPHVAGAQELSVFCAALAGAGVGFLWYNVKPAMVFMGDVGALGIGGALGAVAVMTKNEVLSGIILGLFVVEAVSVVIQRYVFKATRKRVFRMAPIHHHFEKGGWAETQVVVRFWIIALLFCLAALASLKLR
jgi:phospho-N-acetylmuramoyl-pentapeptide-transferase